MARSKKSPPGKPDISGLLDRLAAQEADFLKHEFMAPALRGGVIRIRIAGVACKMRITPVDFQGWGVFQPVSHTAATFVRQATLTERKNYLRLFPSIRLIICRRVGPVWYGSAASFGDSRIDLQGLAPIDLTEEVQLFDCVRTRYDGARFWFEELDQRHDPAAAAHLRAALLDRVAPENLNRRGLTAEERACYELSFWERMRPPEADAGAEFVSNREGTELSRVQIQDDPVQRRLRETLSHAGAQLVDYAERADSFRVSYRVEGRNYTSSVDKNDLTVQVAGICLSGLDHQFDLGSLVGVLREAENDGGIVPVGDVNHGMDEDDYWRIHPQRH